MPDSRFFDRAGPFTLAEVADLSGAAVAEDADRGRTFVDVAPLSTAGPDEVSFLDNKRYIGAFTQSRAGACLVHTDYAAKAPPTMAVLTSPEPYRAYARLARAFYPVAAPEPGVAPNAVIAPGARLGADCRIEAGVVIGEAAEIGARCWIGANTVIGNGVVVGDDSRIGPLATLSHCDVGPRAIIHTGVRIGQDGFGFAMGPQGHLKVPQLGRVVIGSDVEIGANTTIDRGSGPDTRIGDGTKIDNLVQIAHNVEIGRGCVIVSQVGISGSTKVGDFVAMGGQAGLTGHLSIGSGAQIAAQSGIMRDIEPGASVGGSPSRPARQWLREVAVLERLASKKGE